MKAARVVCTAVLLWASLPAAVCGALCAHPTPALAEQAAPPCHGTPAEPIPTPASELCPACEEGDWTAATAPERLADPVAFGAAPSIEAARGRGPLSAARHGFRDPPRSAHAETNAPLLI